MTKSELSKQYTERAESERAAGGKVEVNYMRPYVAVDLSDGSEYFFQGEEAQDLIDEVEKCGLDCSDENTILAIAQNW
tara:strand:- start:670 stop:903 length:234 start_codon:yes stop_codon:yes gene_type:complete